MNVRVTELIPGRLHRIYGVLPLDGSISWAAPADGAEAVSLYAISSPDAVLLVDTGLPVHREGIIAAVRSLVGDRALSILVTRMEPDTLGNLYAMLAELDVRHVAAVAPAPNPFDYANAFPMTRTLAPDAGEKLLRLAREGVQSIHDIDVEVIRAPLRVLATTWLFLEREGVLISSDSFGDTKPASLDAEPVLEHPLRDEELAEVDLHLNTKFGWLRESDAETVLEQTRAVLDARPVRMLAPTHGNVVRGADAVGSYMNGLSRLFKVSATIGGE